MPSVDTVFAVEVDPGKYANPSLNVRTLYHYPWAFNYGMEALEVRDAWRDRGYPDAKVIECKLVKVRDCK